VFHFGKTSRPFSGPDGDGRAWCGINDRHAHERRSGAMPGAACVVGAHADRNDVVARSEG